MKVSSLSCLAGVSTPLIFSAAASAGFVGLDIRKKDNPYDLHVMQIYAVFDRPGEDYMSAVVGTPNHYLIVTPVGGTFYQHPIGSRQAPLQAFVDIFPSLAFDSFLTIGFKAVGDLPDQISFTPAFPTKWLPHQLALTNDAWAVVPMVHAQSDPFNPDYVGGDGSVLIAQFSSADTAVFEGTFLLQFVSNGETMTQPVSFFHVPCPAAWAVLGGAGLLRRKVRR